HCTIAPVLCNVRMASCISYSTELLLAPDRCKSELARAWLAYGGSTQPLAALVNDPEYSAQFWDLHSDSALPDSAFLSARWLDVADGQLQSGVDREQGSPSTSEEFYSAVVELAFRGSESPANWLTNFTADLEKSQVGDSRGHVHRGFQSAYLALRSGLLAQVNISLAALRTSLEAPVLVLVTGHSLGAALATLAAYDLAFLSNVSYEPRCVTWGCPRVGDAEFVAALRQKVPRMARFLNKLDPVPRLPSNPEDPNDDGPLLEVLRAALAQSQQVLGAAGYHHPCPGVQLDVESSGVVHMLLGSIKAASFIQDETWSASRVLEHFISLHLLGSYAESLKRALQQAVLDSVGLEVQGLLAYGSALLAELQGSSGAGLLDLVNLQLHVASDCTQRQLDILGVEPNADGTVRLQRVLEMGPQLLAAEGGAQLLRQAQEHLLSVLPVLAVAAREAGCSGASSDELFEQLETSGTGRELRRWGQQQLKSFEEDPEMLRKCMTSVDLSVVSRWSGSLRTTDVGMCGALVSTVKDSCLHILQSEAAQAQLRAVGVELNDSGSIPLEQVLENGQQLLETEVGREVLRSAQEQASSLLSVLHAQATGAGLTQQPGQLLQQLATTEQGQSLIEWGQERSVLNQADPESLRTLLTSIDLKRVGDSAAVLFDETRAVGLDHLLNKGQQLLETEQGTGLLRDAQKQALSSLLARPAVGAEEAGEEGALSEQSQVYFLQLEKSEQGRQLLEQGRELLAVAEQDPDALKKWLTSLEPSQAIAWQEWGSQLVADQSGSRDDLIRMVKDRCMGFLSEQLPAIKVPKLEWSSDGRQYTVENIDLSACSIDKNHVTIELMSPESSSSTCSDNQTRKEVDTGCGTIPVDASTSRADVFQVMAREISVEIPDLQWSYEQLHFPYMHGHGSAHTVACGARIMIVFQLQSLKVDGSLAPRLALARCDVAIEQFTLDIRGSTFSWLYNTLASLFQGTVKSYVIIALQEALTNNISSLLAPLNQYLTPYWPLLLSTCGLSVEMLPMSDDGEEYMVCLDLSAGEPLGLEFADFETRQGPMLRVHHVAEQGPVAEWNSRAVRDFSVAVGDALLEVSDGVCDATELQRDLLAQTYNSHATSPHFRMLFRRGPDPAKTELDDFVDAPGAESQELSQAVAPSVASLVSGFQPPPRLVHDAI
ncbi:unnamed protein product, partial [Polarella glacialis]